MLSLRKLFNIARKQEWKVSYSKEDKTVELENWSPADQDLVIELEASSPEELIESLRYYIESYNPWEEAQIWIKDGKGQRGAPEDPEDVLRDMKECKKMMKNLLEAWTKPNYERKSSYDVCIMPCVNVQVSVNDPHHPTDEEMRDIINEAYEKAKDNIEDLLQEDNLESVTLINEDTKKAPLIWQRPICPLPDLVSFTKAFNNQTKTLLYKALGIINNYNGSKIQKLTSGEKAVDMDDAWVIIDKRGSRLRDKRVQKTYDPENKKAFRNKCAKTDIRLIDVANNLSSDYTLIFNIADFLS